LPEKNALIITAIAVKMLPGICSQQINVVLPLKPRKRQAKRPNTHPSNTNKKAPVHAIRANRGFTSSKFSS
jgi:hypothetical protein